LLGGSSAGGEESIEVKSLAALGGVARQEKRGG